MRLLILFISFLISQVADSQIINASQPYRVTAAPAACDTKLLDDYPGAAGAWSLRKLDADYAGSAIRVRRSSDNTEQDIGFTGACGDLDTAAMKTFVGAGNGFIVTWYDQSGSNDATQSTTTYQPAIISGGVVERVDGLPAINFATQLSLFLPTGFLYNEAAFSYFHVGRIPSFGGSNTGVFAPSASNSVGLEILQTSVISRPSLLRINNVIKNDNSAAAYQLWADGAQSLTEIYADATATSAYRDNTSVTLTSTAAIAALNFNGVYAIGRYNAVGNSMTGRLQEVIIYNSNQSSNRTGIASNINAYYGIY